MSLLITGASGSLGRRAAELLLDTDNVDPGDVILVTRSPDKLADLAARGAQVRHGDFAEPETLTTAFAGATRVLIISANELGARVAQHQHAIDAATAAGAQLIAYTSIPNPDPGRNAAGVVPDHAATEQAVIDSGVPYTFLRNGLYSQNYIPEAQGAIAQGVLVYNSGDGATAYVSRDDCAAVATVVLAGGDEHAGQAYDLTGPETLSGAQLAALYGSIGGVEVQPDAVDDASLIAGVIEHGMPEPFAQLLASFGKAIRDGALNQLSTDVNRLTGREPADMREVLEAAGLGRN